MAKANIDLFKQLGDLMLYAVKNKTYQKKVLIGKASPHLIKEALKFNLDLKGFDIYVAGQTHSLYQHYEC